MKRSAAILVLALIGAAHPCRAFEPLPRTGADSHEIPESALEAFVEEIRAAPGARSLVVVHRGHVIAEFFPWATSGNPNRYILDKPLVADPGTTFVYNTATTHVLSPVLEELTDRQVEGFAAEFLFAPLGITNWRWEADAQGYAFGGHGLQLRTEDMAKLGLLFLQHGWWQGERVVSTGWVRTATFPHVPGNQPWGAVDNLQYGFLWWLGEGDESPLYFALGWGGQFVVCVPDRDLVVATTANWQVSAEQARAQEGALMNAIVQSLLPIVPQRRPDARAPAGRSGGAALAPKLSSPFVREPAPPLSDP